MTANTTPSEQQCCAATPEELCAGALKHYDELSTKACNWMNQIPQAIRFWYLEKPKLERELAAARAETLERAANLQYERAMKRHGWDKHGDADAIRALPDAKGQTGTPRTVL